ncbi:MAG: right-handed parallel beta-helix repeat-containing protein [Armatimonadota bacterium]
MPSQMLTLMLLMMAAGVASCQVNQEMIDRVAAGEVTEARASWWGYDAEDATACLQAAIDSGVPKLIVENMGTPWIVTPITLRSNQEIIFEEGVEVLAKRGEFQPIGAALFRGSMIENLILRGYGATFRMWRDDYANPELYRHGEWRHCLNLSGCSNVQVLGLTLTESGGDGIYLGSGTDRLPCRNIVIKDVTCDANYRQGISVICAQDLLIEDCVLSNTAGAPPEAGIDFEPNDPRERLVNVVMRNCLTTGNRTSGYVVAVPQLDATSEPLSMRFENCRSVNDGHNPASVTLGATLAGAVDGTIEFVGCSFEGGRNAGLQICKPAERGRVRVADCQILDCATSRTTLAPIMLASRAGGDAPVGGVQFDAVLVRDSVDRPPLGYNDQSGGLPLRDVTGAIIVEREGRRTTYELTPELLAQWAPVQAMADIPRLSIEGMTFAPLAEEPPLAALGPSPWPLVRGTGSYVLYAEEGDEVGFTVSFQQLGRYLGTDMPITIIGPAGDEVHTTKVPFKADTPVQFTAPATGLYRFTLSAGGNRSQIMAPSHPMALVIGERPVGLSCAGGTFAFCVPPGATQFGVRVAGQGTGEAIRAALINPAGEVVEEVDNQFQTHQFEVRFDPPSAGEVWAIRLAGPSQMVWDDHTLDLRGVPPLLAPVGAPLLAPAAD